MSVTKSDLATVRAHIDAIASDDTPTYHNLGLLLALEAVIERAQAMPGPCDECRHWDGRGETWGYCTRDASPHHGKPMLATEGCTQFEAEP